MMLWMVCGVLSANRIKILIIIKAIFSENTNLCQYSTHILTPPFELIFDYKKTCVFFISNKVQNLRHKQILASLNVFLIYCVLIFYLIENHKSQHNVSLNYEPYRHFTAHQECFISNQSQHEDYYSRCVII
jgi:hypothetical protein